MSVHDPLSRKRDMPENLPDLKRQRPERDSDTFSDKMYSVYVKSAIDAVEKVCLNFEMFSGIHDHKVTRDCWSITLILSRSQRLDS